MSDEQSIFNETLAKESALERSAFLDEACLGNPEMRARVEVLLAAHESAGQFLESPPTAVQSAAPTLPERPGTMIGPYKLLEQIGEGGMGVVFIAEQTRPLIRRVALKIVKPGMDTKQVIARFEAERQALAMMDHPNIAKVLDAGATDTGRPFFVMELVKGIPITQYCDEQQLTPRQRLELFVQVCQAVQHAHQKGIIHRDIKPTNVLVTLADDGRPTPKVIDFGIAKATAGQRLTERTLYTELRQLIGTPLYMSPEQAEMSALMDADTRSDVYSLGVLLYELLTGTTPFEKERLAQAAHDEVRRIIREEEPPRPSTRISTLGQTLTSISSRRGVDPKTLRQTVTGELDWIVMRAMEKDRARRYETAISFAHDVERYLADQPVEACPPSRTYRLKKFVRRNKPAITTGAALLLMLASATAVSVWQAVRATRADHRATRERDQALAEGRRADEQAAIANAVNAFLNEDVLGQASPFNQRGADTTPDRDLRVRDALDRAVGRIEGRFHNQPLVEAAIRNTMGDALADLGEYQKGEQQLEAALRLRRRALGDSHPDTLATLTLLGGSYLSQDLLDRAEPIFTQVLETNRRLRGERDPATLEASWAIGTLYVAKKDYPKAEAILRATLDTQRAVLGNGNRKTLQTMDALGDTYMHLRQYSKAEPLILEALDGRSKLLGETHPETVYSALSLAWLYQEQRKLKAAESILLRALDSSRQTFGEKGKRTLDVLAFLGNVYEEQGDTKRAAAMKEQLLDARRQVQGEHDPATLTSMVSLGALYARRGEFAKAEPLLIQSLAELRKVRGNRHEDTLVALDCLGLLYMRQQRFDKAEPFWAEALQTAREMDGPEHPDTLVCSSNLAILYKNQKRYDKAEPLFLEALSGERKILGVLHQNTMTTTSELASMYVDLRRFPDAERLLQERLELTRKSVRADDPNLAEALYDFAVVKKSQGKLDESEQLMNQALVIRRKAMGNLDPAVATNLVALGGVLQQAQKYADAERAFRETVEIRQRLYPHGSWLLANSKRLVASVLVPQRKYEEAERLLLQANEEFRATQPPPSWSFLVQDAVKQTVELYEQWGKPAQAAAWRAKLPATQPATAPATRPAPAAPV